MWLHFCRQCLATDNHPFPIGSWLRGSSLRRSVCSFFAVRHLLVAVVVTLFCGQVPSTSCAEEKLSTLSVVRIEEDWELVVGAPDEASESPQIRCVMSPTRDIDSDHMAFTINHRTEPSYTAGGLQLQLWQGDKPDKAKSAATNALLSFDEEVVEWTQAMSVDNGTLTFEITEGSSMTWKNFGGQGELEISTATTRTELNSYHPRVSVKHSGVGFGANRVKTLVLREVRAYSTSGLLWRGAGPNSTTPTPQAGDGK